MRILRTSALVLAAVAFTAAACEHPGGQFSPASTGSAVAITGPDNGIAERPAEEIASVAVAGLTGNYPMRIKGSVMSGTKVVTFDVVRSFQEGQGTMQLDGRTFELIRVGGHDFLKADPEFWSSRGPSEPPDPARAARVHGRWVRAPLYAEGFPVGADLDIHDNIWEALANDHQLAKGERRTINGVPTIALSSGNLGMVYVATVGAPNVVRVESETGDRIDYSEHGSPVVIVEPAADQTVDIEVVLGTG